MRTITRHFLDLPSSVCRISKRDAMDAVEAGDIAEIQRWIDGGGDDPSRQVTIVLYRATNTNRGTMHPVEKYDAR